MAQTKSEIAFFAMYDLVSNYATEHNIPTHQVMSIRQVWDLAYATGVAHASADALATLKGDTATETATL
jgi:hypothetical protein